MAIPDRRRIKDALVELIEQKGGRQKAITPKEAYKGLAERFQLTEEDLALERDWESLWPNEVRWARQELVTEGTLLPQDESGHGVWQLSDTRSELPSKASLGSSPQTETELELIYADLRDEGVFDPKGLSDARDIQLRAIVQRRGQQPFRDLLLREYQKRCAITGETCIATLEAAHIVPYLGVETNRIENGLLLRSDIHTLFDLHLIYIGDSFRVSLSPSLISTGYRCLEGKTLLLPANPKSHPSTTALEQHRSQCDF